MTKIMGIRDYGILLKICRFLLTFMQIEITNRKYDIKQARLSHLFKMKNPSFSISHLMC